MDKSVWVILGLKDQMSAGLQNSQANIKAFSQATTLAVAGAAVGFAALTASAIQSASDVSESQNKVNVVFGESAKYVSDFAAQGATALGMTRGQALETAGTFGNLFTSMGIGRDASAGMSTQMLQLATDLSSFNNIPIADVLEKMRAGLVGEAEPMRTLGVTIDDATMRTKLAEMGFTNLGKTLTGGQKAVAAYQIMMAQTTNAQGDFARTSDGLANSTRIIQSTLMDAKAAFGQEFLPAVEKAAAVLKDVLPVAIYMALGAFRAVKGAVADAVAALVPVWAALQPAVQGLKNIALGLLSLVAQDPKPWIAALAAVLLTLMVPALMAAAGSAFTFLLSIAPLLLAAGAVGAVVFVLATNFMGLRDVLMSGVNAALAFLGQHMGIVYTALAMVGLTIATTVIPALGGLLMSLLSAGLGALAFAGHLLFGGVIAVGSFAVSLLTTGIGAVVGFVTALVTGGVAGVLTWVGSIIGGMIPANVAAAASFITGLIPGAVAAATTLIGTTIPAAAASAATFLTTTIPAVIATGVSFLTGLIPSLIATAVTFLTTTIPAAVATGVAFLSMVIGALAAFASLVIGAIATGISVVIAFLPIILVAAAIGVAIYLLYKNWSSIWTWIVKITGQAAQRIVTWLKQAITWVANIVGKGLTWVRNAFSSIWTSVAKTTGKFASSVYNTVVSGISKMADKVSDIISKLAKWIGEAFSKIVNFIGNAIRSLPGADRVIALLGGIGTTISNTLSGLKKAFGGDDNKWQDSTMEDFGKGGEDAGTSFMDGIKDVMSGETSLSDFVMDAMGMGDMGSDLTSGIDTSGGAAAGGGAGGAGAAAKDPLGMWEGTDSSGHWVIDPATGKKVYDAGSVGATKQEANAAKAASSEASKQAKSASKVGSAATAASGSANLDLAKAFTNAIGDAITLMNDLVAADIPAAELYQPQLDKVKGFFLSVGRVFASLASNATTSALWGDKARDLPLHKGELKNITKWADPFQQAIDAMSKGIDLIERMNELVVPGPEILEQVKVFLLQAGRIAIDVAAQANGPALTGLAAINEAFGKWLDVLSKAATTAKTLGETEIADDISSSVDEVAAFLVAVSIKTGQMVDGAMRALGDELADALSTSTDLATTFAAWMDTLAKVSAAVTSVNGIKYDPAQIEQLRLFLSGLSLMTGTFVVGMGKAYAPDARAKVLELSRDLANTFGVWFDSLSKLATAATALANAKPIPDGTLTKVQQLLSDVAWITHNLLVGEGYDLTANKEKSAADFAVARDLFTTLSAGLDALAKAAGLDLSKAVAVTEDQLLVAAKNARDALDMMVRLAGQWGSMAEKMRTDVFTRVKDYASLIAPVVDAITKAGNLGLDKAQRATSDQLVIAEDNARSAVATVVRLADDWSMMVSSMRDELFARIKAYTEIVGPCVDLVSKTATLGLDDAVLATSRGLEIAEANARAAVALVKRLADAWSTMETKARDTLFASITAYADIVGPCVDAISAAANLGLDEAVLATMDGLYIAQENMRMAVQAVYELTIAWTAMGTEVQTKLWPAMEAYSKMAGEAVEAVSKAASLGTDMASATAILPDRIGVVQSNIAVAVSMVHSLTLGWSHLDDETRTKLFAEIEAYADTAGKAVEAVSKAAQLGKDMAESTIVPAGAWRMVESNMLSGVLALIAIVKSVGSAAMAEARAAAEASGPVMDAIGKALEIFTLDKIMKSPFIAKNRSKASATYAQGRADMLKASIVLMFDTLRRAVTDIGPVPSEVGTYATAMVAAYSPLLDLIEKINGLTIDLDKIAQLAQVPGLLAAGLGAGSGGGTGGYATILGGGPVTLTGPVTAVGPLYFQGTQTVEVSLEGDVLQRTIRSGDADAGRNRGYRAATP